jgi:YodL-like
VKINYLLLLNESKDAEGRLIAMMDGHTNGDPLVLAYSGIVESSRTKKDIAEITNAEVFNLADSIFREFNIEHPDDYRNRSLSVGDVILFLTEPKWIGVRVEPYGFTCTSYITDLYWNRNVKSC